MCTRQMSRTLPLILWTALAILTAPGAATAQPQSNDQQKCINQMNKAGSKVAARQGKEGAACIKNAGKSRETHPDLCLTRDGKGKVARTSARVGDAYTNSCVAAPPDFGLISGPDGPPVAVVDAAIDGELQLLYDIFGIPLTPALATDRDGAKCQAAVSKRYAKVAAAYMKAFVKCKKTTLDGGAASAMDLEPCVLDDARGKAASAVAKLDQDIERKCTANLFPGACAAAALGDLASCLHGRVRCSVCLLQNAMDGLDANCDVADDGMSDDSCTVAPNFIVRRRIEKLAPVANLGHRGTGVMRPGHPFPENSLSSYLEAMNQGADGIELDVELTSDGQLVIMHDDTLDRTTTCTGCVSAFTLAQVQACALLDGDGVPTADVPPTLAEVYAVLPADALVNIELKVFDEDCATPSTGPVDLAQAAVAEVQTLGAENRSLFSSFDLTAAATVKAEDPGLYAAYLVVLADGDTIPDATAAGLDAVHPLFVIGAPDVDAMRAAGFQVNVWTVNTETAMQQSIDKGVSAIITDEPALLEQVLSAN